MFIVVVAALVLATYWYPLETGGHFWGSLALLQQGSHTHTHTHRARQALTDTVGYKMQPPTHITKCIYLSLKLNKKKK